MTRKREEPASVRRPDPDSTGQQDFERPPRSWLEQVPKLPIEAYWGIFPDLDTTVERDDDRV
jgi:hypothetical protein